MSLYYGFLIRGVLAFVTSTIKNQKSNTEYDEILTQLRDAINELLAMRGK